MITNNVYSKPIFVGKSIAASGSLLSEAIDLGALQPNGYFAMQISFTGTGTAKAEILVTTDGPDEPTSTAQGFMLPSSGSSIATGLTTASGPYYSTVTVPPCRQFKIKITETGGANAIVPTGKLVII